MAVSAGGLTALVASSASAAAVANGPITFSDSTQWNEVNADGTGQKTVTPSGGGFNYDAIGDVSFSRDGSHVAFADRTTHTVWVAQGDGTNAHAITTPVNGDTTGDATPVWSPDGKTIVFAHLYVDASNSLQATLYSVPSDGSAAPTKLAVSSTCGSSHPSFAPNGDLAFTGCAGAAKAEALEIVSLASPQTVRTSIPGYYGGQFSPDGSRIAAWKQPAAGSVGPATQLYLMAADGTGSKVFYWGSAGCGVAWSPDSTALAMSDCVSNNSGSSFNVDVQQVASSTPVHVAANIPSRWGTGGALAWPVPYAAPPPPPGNPGPTPGGKPFTLRLGGGDRVATSVAVAEAGYGPGVAGAATAKAAVLSRSDNFADALAGNALAAQKGGPLLLTGGAKLDPAVAAELSRILPRGATVYVLGGTGALSAQIETDVQRLGLTVRRLNGADRFETATKIAAEISPAPHTVMVATGVNFPDALAAGAAAAQDPNGGVVVLSNNGVLPASTKAYLASVDLAKTNVYGVGGQGVAALATMPSLAGHVVPLSGGDRYATDLAVTSNATLFPAPPTAGLATGTNWPDALSGGAFIGAAHGPLLLTNGDSLTLGEEAWLHGHSAQLKSLAVFGGVGVVPDPAVVQAGNAAWGIGAWTEK